MNKIVARLRKIICKHQYICEISKESGHNIYYCEKCGYVLKVNWKKMHM